MAKRDKVTLKRNNVLTNDPCALCGERCDPGGLDYFLDGTERLVCDQCAARLAPELVQAQRAYYAAGCDWEERDPEHAATIPAIIECGRCGGAVPVKGWGVWSTCPVCGIRQRSTPGTRDRATTPDAGEPLARPWTPTGLQPPEHCAACGLAIEPMLPNHWEECPECGAREYIASEDQCAMPVVEDHNAQAQEAAAKLEELKAGLLGLELARIEGEQAALQAELERVRGKRGKVGRKLNKTKLGARFFRLWDYESDLREREQDLSWKVRSEYERLERLVKVQAGELTLEAAGLGTDLQWKPTHYATDGVPF